MFGGKTYDPARDENRLVLQLGQVWDATRDGKWHTLPELSRRLRAPEQSVSARLRDLRKERFGAYDVQREYVSDGLWKYRVVKR